MAQIVPGVRPSCPMSACVPVASEGQTPLDSWTLAVEDFMGTTKEDYWRDWRSGELFSMVFLIHLDSLHRTFEL